MRKITALTILFCLFLCDSACAVADPRSAKIDSLKAALKLESDAYELASLCYEVTEHYYPFDFDSSLFYARQYLNASMETNDSLWIADAYSYISYIYDQKGYLGLAAENCKKALEIYTELDEQEFMAACYNNLGYLITYGTDQPGGLDYFLKSLSIAETVQDSSLISLACCNVAYFYERLGDLKTASIFYRRSFEIDSQRSDDAQLALSYANMANINLLQGNIPQAEDHLARSKALVSSTTETPYEMAYMYSTFADTYLEWGSSDSARKYIELSLKIIEEHDFILISAYVYRQQGYLSYLEKDYRACIGFLRESIRLYTEIGGTEPFYRIYTKMAEAYARLSSYEEAYKAELMANEFYESLNYGAVAGILSRHEQEQLNNIKLRNTALQFALEKQRMDNANLHTRANLKIALITIILLIILAGFVTFSLFIIRKKNSVLRAKNTLIKEQKELLEKQIERLEISEDELKGLNATKDKFFSIIAHDLKGPLSAIMGLSDLFLEKKDRLDSVSIVPIIKSINTSSCFGVSLLDNLLEWARSQTGVMKPKPTILQLDTVLNSLLTDFSAIASGKQIILDFPGETPAPVYADENMVTTVMRNLIQNAIKFSHCGGVIKVTTYKEDKFLLTSIEDQGIGISKKELSKLFSIDGNLRKVGTNNEEGSGLGLILCKEFIEKNNGAIWAEGEEHRGCKFTFSLPLAEVYK